MCKLRALEFMLRQVSPGSEVPRSVSYRGLKEMVVRGAQTGGVRVGGSLLSSVTCACFQCLP